MPTNVHISNIQYLAARLFSLIFNWYISPAGRWCINIKNIISYLFNCQIIASGQIIKSMLWFHQPFQQSALFWLHILILASVGVYVCNISAGTVSIRCFMCTKIFSYCVPVNMVNVNHVGPRFTKWIMTEKMFLCQNLHFAINCHCQNVGYSIYVILLNVNHFAWSLVTLGRCSLQKSVNMRNML